LLERRGAEQLWGEKKQGRWTFGGYRKDFPTPTKVFKSRENQKTREKEGANKVNNGRWPAQNGLFGVKKKTMCNVGGRGKGTQCRLNAIVGSYCRGGKKFPLETHSAEGDAKAGKGGGGSSVPSRAKRRTQKEALLGWGVSSDLGWTKRKTAMRRKLPTHPYLKKGDRAQGFPPRGNGGREKREGGKPLGVDN